MLDVRPQQVRFPARCAGCGATPSRHVTLEAWRGRDLLVVRWGRYCEVPIPMCQRCWARRWRRRVAWFAALPLSVVAVIGVAVGLGQAFGEEWIQLLAGVLVVVLVPLVLLLRGREQEWFQRLSSPVWLRRWRPDEDRVELHFGDEKLQHEVGVLSGLIDEAPRAVGYRESAQPLMQPAWGGPQPMKIPWWSALILGGAFIAVAIGEWVQYSSFERTGHSFSDEALFVFLYELGGKYLLSGLLGAFGVAFCAAALVWRHLVRRR